MKRLALLVLGVTGIFAPAWALPPDDKELKGEYWDEWNVDKVEFLVGGKAVWTTFGTKATVRGEFSVPKDGQLKFVPEGGAPVRTWKCAFQEGLLVLTDEYGVERNYRPESLDRRRSRTADLLIEVARLDKARRVAGDEPDDAGLSLKDRELEARYAGMLVSLGEDPKGPPPPSILLVVKLRRPDIYDDMVAALKQAMESSRVTDCKNRLKQIGIYVALHESRFRKYPQSLKDLLQEGLADDDSWFRCSLSGKPNSFTFVAPPNGDDTPPDFVIAYDTDAHPDGRRNVLTLAGSVTDFDAEDFTTACKDGTRAAGPHLNVKSAQILAKQDGYEAVIEGTITNLRAIEKDGGKFHRADLELSSFSKGHFKAKPQQFEGPADTDGLPFRAVLKLGTKDPGKGVAVMVDFRDFGRGKSRFNEYVDFDSVGKKPRR